MSASCARWPPESLRARWAPSSPSRAIRSRARSASHPGLSCAPSRRCSSTLRSRVRRRVLRDEPDLRHPGPAAARPAPRSPRTSARASRPRGSAACSCPRRWARRGRRHGPPAPRACSSASAVRRPKRLVSRVGSQHRGHATSRSASWRKVVVNRASMLSSSRPASRALVSQRSRSLRSGACDGERRVGQRPRHERPDPRARGDEPVALELPVRLEHRVGVDRQPRHDLLDRGELIALAQQAEPQRVPHLPHQLLVRREPGGRHPGGIQSFN